MYHTPDGDRILLGAEREFFTQSLAMIIHLLAEDDMEFGVTGFDQLQRNQKLVVLYNAARGLLHPDEPPPRLTAALESAVAAVYEFAMDQVRQEIDPEIGGEGPHWRKLILDIARQHIDPDELPDATNDDEETWAFLVECLMGCVLWDSDYESQQTLDLPPEESRQVRSILGVDDDYHTAIPEDPPDHQAKLYLDALIGLTRDAR